MSVLHTIGFIRAIAGALDCFGASVVGVAAVKTNLLRADLDSARRALGQVTGAAGDRIQADIRAQLEALIERVGPPGWFRWTLDLRNTVIHRGRRLQLSELRPIPSDSLVPPSLGGAQAMAERFRRYATSRMRLFQNRRSG